MIESEKRLYGTPGAEHMYVDLASAYESELEPYGKDEIEPGQREELEEWTVHPPSYHLPSATQLLERISEWAYDYGELYDDFEVDAVNDPEAVKLTEALLNHIASGITWRMADVKVGSHWVTWDDEGEPLLDGELMYIKREDLIPISIGTEERNSND